MEFQIHEKLADGTTWVSPIELKFTGDHRAAAQAVLAGHTNQPRAAVEVGTGKVIYAINQHGTVGPIAAALFEQKKAPA